MEEIKIECPCGARYKFDFEPVNHRLPAPVACPVCKRDGTEIGNRIMSERYPTPTPAPSTPPRAYPVARPVAAAAESMEASAETPSAVKPGLRFNRPAEPEHFATGESTADAPVSPPVNRPSVPVAAAPRKTAKSGEPNFRMAVVGAVTGGLIGMFTWYGFAKMTGLELGWIAWGIGGITGLFTRWLGRYTSNNYGVIAALCALLAIMGGRVLFVFTELNHLVGDSLQEVEKSQLEYARAAVTNVTDEDFRIFLARDMADDNGKLDTNRVTATAIEKFKTEELPDLRKLASGQTGAKQGAFSTFGILLGAALMSLFGIKMIIWLILGLSTAYKLASGFD